MTKPPLDTFVGDTLEPHAGKPWKDVTKYLVDTFLQDQLLESAHSIIQTTVTISPQEKKTIQQLFDRFAEAHDAGNTKLLMKLSDDLRQFGEKKLHKALPFYQFSKHLVLRIQLLIENERRNEVAPLLNASIAYDEEMAKINSSFIYDLTRLKTAYLLHRKEYAKVIALVNGFLNSWYKIPENDLLENLLIAKSKALHALKQYSQAFDTLDQIFSFLGDSILDNKAALAEIFVLQWKMSFELKRYDEAREAFMVAVDYDPNNQEAVDYLFYKLPVPQGPSISMIKKEEEK